MKIKGRKDLSFKRRVKFPLLMQDADGNDVALDLTLVNLNVGFEEEMNKLLPLPTPPERQVKDTKGNLSFDLKGVPEMEPNEEDPAYLEEFHEMRGLQAMYMIEHALSEDKVLEFETAPIADAKLYYKALFKELQDCGFAGGTILKLAKRVLEISGFLEEDMTKAKSFFSQAEAPKAEGELSSIASTES